MFAVGVRGCVHAGGRVSWPRLRLVRGRRCGKEYADRSITFAGKRQTDAEKEGESLATPENSQGTAVADPSEPNK